MDSLAMSRQDSKGQGLSVQTLVIIALGILVLISAILAYNKVSGGVIPTVTDCGNQGGECRSSCLPGEQTNLQATSCQEGQRCCMPRAG